MLPSIFGENLFDNFFDNAFESALVPANNALYGKHAKNMMKTDVKETDNGYSIAIDIPGFKKDEVNVDLTNGYLTVTAAKGLEKDDKDKEGHFIRRERYSGSCTRSFYLGDVKPEQIKCKYENGVLTLDVPKEDPVAKNTPNRIEIE